MILKREKKPTIFKHGIWLLEAVLIFINFSSLNYFMNYILQVHGLEEE